MPQYTDRAPRSSATSGRLKREKNSAQTPVWRE
jgi:hypothetical protein